ncbi:LysR family transcriptional regulator [Glutamicibacter sp. JL.03c]|uniref:LysR family transcriptional regulator n=1 Tax=Glutamicibacter sp. JL.03c TaxID=2984842 RepID=UPI0021F7B962|nr:LysR family transcriptional regulator [Glutamicibacter sp. JL.03c]UYQ77269.1 LysR family transcriptional regulator [Glutamicibacter sp. JL.03c]
MDLTLHQLRCFIAVADTLHFARAAGLLHLSPSTLSGQISALERQLECKLFERSPRTVLLTAKGLELVPMARETLNSSERILDWSRSPQKSVLHLGTPAASAGLRAILQAATARMPRVDLRLRPSGFTGGLQAVERREADCAFVFDLNPGASYPGLKTSVLWGEELVVAMPEAHRFAARDRVTVDDLLGETLIGPAQTQPAGHAPGRYWYETIDPRLPQQCTIKHLVDSADEAMELVSAGIGMNIAGSSVISSYARPGVRFVPLDTELRVWVLLATRDEKLSPELESFLRIATARTGDPDRACGRDEAASAGPADIVDASSDVDPVR